MRKRPDAIVVVTAVAVIAACVALAAAVVPEGLYPETPFSFCGAVLIIPFCLIAAAAQYFAAFRARAAAARLVTNCCFIVAGFFALAVVTSAGEMIRAAGPNQPGIVWMFVLFGALGGLAAAAGAVNRRWAKVLRAPPPLAVCHVCGYDLRATPDRCPECGTESKAAGSA